MSEKIFGGWVSEKIFGGWVSEKIFEPFFEKIFEWSEKIFGGLRRSLVV